MAQTEGYSSIPEERNENEVDGQQGREAKDSFFEKIRKVCFLTVYKNFCTTFRAHNSPA